MRSELRRRETYQIKEIFLSIQGEGFHAGRAAIFVRFTGCNFWSGREEDRAKAICNFCDTDFINTDGSHGGRYTEQELANKINDIWQGDQTPFVVLTGGEPLLQVDEYLIGCLKDSGMYLAVETNGSLIVPEGIDWICVSPKSLQHFVQHTGNEIKLVYPQAKLSPEDFDDYRFEHFYLQPLDGNDTEVNTAKTVEYIQSHPRWQLSIQLHKILGLQ